MSALATFWFTDLDQGVCVFLKKNQHDLIYLNSSVASKTFRQSMVQLNGTVIYAVSC